MNVTHIKTEAYYLHIQQTTQFKTNRILVSFSEPLNEHDLAARATLAYMMKSVSQAYPSRAKQSLHLQELYASRFDVHLHKLGNTHMISFDLSVINDQYTLSDSSLLQQGIEFLHNVLFQPLIDEQTMQEEARLIMEYIQSLRANKMRYALKQARELMFKDDPYRLSSHGTIEQLTALTIQDIKRVYKQMITSNAIHISVVGDIQLDDIKSLLADSFPFTPRTQPLHCIDRQINTRKSVQKQKETMNVNQAKVVLGFHLPVYYDEKNYRNAALFNAILGGSSDSILFSVIREKLGYAYHIASSYDPLKGVLFIYAGVDQSNVTSLEREIESIIESIQHKTISPDYLSVAKQAIVHSVIQSRDSIYSLAMLAIRNYLFDKPMDLSSVLQEIDCVTMKDIQTVSESLLLDTVYILQGETE